MKHVAILNVPLTECTLEAHSPQTGFQYIVLRLWSTVDALTDADSVVRLTTVGVSNARDIFTGNNDWKKNGNVYFVIGQRVFPVHLKIMYNPW